MLPKKLLPAYHVAICARVIEKYYSYHDFQFVGKNNKKKCDILKAAGLQILHIKFVLPHGYSVPSQNECLRDDVRL